MAKHFNSQTSFPLCLMYSLSISSLASSEIHRFACAANRARGSGLARACSRANTRVSLKCLIVPTATFSSKALLQNGPDADTFTTDWASTSVIQCTTL